MVQNYLKPINYFEKKGSAQCKSSVILAALNTPGKTIIKAKKSRDHTELFLKYLKLPIKIIKKNKFDIIEIIGEKQFKSFNYDCTRRYKFKCFFYCSNFFQKIQNLKLKMLILIHLELDLLK